MYKMIICIEDTIGVAGKIWFGTKICENQSKQTNYTFQNANNEL